MVREAGGRGGGGECPFGSLMTCHCLADLWTITSDGEDNTLGNIHDLSDAIPTPTGGRGLDEFNHTQ